MGNDAMEIAVSLTRKEEEQYCVNEARYKRQIKDFMTEFKNCCTPQEWSIVVLRHFLTKQASWRQIGRRMNLHPWKAYRIYKRALLRYREKTKEG
jgi:hypothetical protein